MAARSSSCTNMLRTISRSRNPIITHARGYASSSSSSERPLYPSVEALLHEHDLKASDVKSTGPGGRLLKGDVLAHIGQIPSSAPESLSKKFSKWSHLDLSNITPAAPKEAKKDDKAAAVEEEVEQEYELALPIDLKPVLKLQQKLEDTLGHAPPLSELLARAIGLANTALPAASRAPTADELFDDIVGSSTNHGVRLSDGRFLPFIAGPSATIPIFSQPVNIFDELVAPAGASKKKAIVPQDLSMAQLGAVNEFSVTVSAAERKRALVFLQRMKSVLEVEPGRLVL